MLIACLSTVVIKVQEVALIAHLTIGILMTLVDLRQAHNQADS